MAVGMATAGALGIKALLAKLGIGAAAKGAVAAGTKMAAGNAFRTSLGKALFGGMSKGQIAQRLAPDAIFGGMAAFQTPGDFTDKAIAGGTQFIGGGLGGLALGKVAGKINPNLEFPADFIGSYGGDVAGMAIGDTLQRGKDKIMGGEGRTAYERMSDEQQQQFAEQIRQQTLMGAGLVPGLQEQYGYMG